MPNININTNAGGYQALLNGLETLKTTLAPRIAVLRELPRAQQKQWLARDPLMRRSILLARKLSDIYNEELSE